MTEDTLYLLFCYLIFGLTLGALAYRSRNRGKTVTVHLIIAGLYSGFLLYNLRYNSSGGSGLVWLVFLMACLGVHVLVNLIGIVLTFKNR